MIDEEITPDESHPQDGGRGDEPYLTPAQKNKIISLMLHADREAWPITPEHEQDAVKTTLDVMKEGNAREKNGAIRNLVAMKGQILKQIEMRKPAAVNATQVNINGKPADDGLTIEVIEYDELPPRVELPGDGEGDQS